MVHKVDDFQGNHRPLESTFQHCLVGKECGPEPRKGAMHEGGGGVAVINSVIETVHE